MISGFGVASNAFLSGLALPTYQLYRKVPFSGKGAPLGRVHRPFSRGFDVKMGGCPRKTFGCEGKTSGSATGTDGFRTETNGFGIETDGFEIKTDGLKNETFGF